MMRRIGHILAGTAGAKRPSAGVFGPQLASLVVAFACASVAAGCGTQEQSQNLKPEQVGIMPDTPPIFKDDESELFEVKRGMQFPIVQPSPDQEAELAGQAVVPYGRMPWLTNKDVKVQLTWTLSNLDDQQHVVELLIDPWNEFGRYYPGMTLTNAEEQTFQPNSSGIDQYFVLDPTSAGDSSRRHGTYTFDDMNEMAIDFATVQNMINWPEPLPLPGGVESDPDMMTNPLPIYVNHAFNLINHSYNDPLIARYIPAVVAGLTGIDFGFRTTEKSKVAMDIQIEIVDSGQNRVQAKGTTEPLLAPSSVVVTVGSAVPAPM